MRFAVGLLLIGASISFASEAPGRLLSSLPLRFEQNAQHRWTSRGSGYVWLFDRDATVLRVADREVRLRFEDSNTAASFKATGQMQAPTNYFIGHAFRSAAGFSHLRRAGVYPGVDVVFYGAGGQLEYDFNLAPGADPSKIAMHFDGADGVSVNERGEIVLRLDSEQVVQKIPVVYQKRGLNELAAVESHYRMDAAGTIRLVLGQYDVAKALVIDPAIVYANYLGGTYADGITAMAHDSHGFLYLGGYTYSTDFPAGGDVIQPFPITSNIPPRDAWVMKINPFASNPNNSISYSTYFGGGLSTDLRSLTVDANGRIYFGGVTLAPDLPVTPSAFQTTLPNTNAVNVGFVSVIDPAQGGKASLIYSTYYGGATAANEINGLAIRGSLIYVAGWTNTDDLPLAGNPYSSARTGGYDAFIAEFDAARSGTDSLLFATYLGGSTTDVARSIAVDPAGVVYVTGYSVSTDFPTTPNSAAPGYLGGEDAFLVQMDPGSGMLLYSTFLGGFDLDVGTKVLWEPSGRVAVAGYTFSPNFPVTPSAVQPLNRGNGDAFIAELDLNVPGPRAVVYGTYYGGSDTDVPYDFRRDANGLYYLAGYTISKDFPVSGGALNPTSDNGGLDGFVAVINPARALVYGSYITSPGYQAAYAVDFDAAGNVYVAGTASSAVFPDGYTPKSTATANYDGFLMIFSLATPAGGSALPARTLARPAPRRNK